jgi:hypothetical protein
MEETQNRFRRLADDLEYLVASTAPGVLTFDRIDVIFNSYQDIWADLGRTWLEHRWQPTSTSST